MSDEVKKPDAKVTEAKAPEAAAPQPKLSKADVEFAKAAVADYKRIRPIIQRQRASL